MHLSHKLLERIIGGSDPEREASPAAPAVAETLAPGSDHEGASTAAIASSDSITGGGTTLIAAPARAAAVMPAGARQLDRRRATRLPIGDRARICLDRDKAMGLWDTVMLQDISLAGISFLSSQWLSQGDVFEMCLRDRTRATIQLHCIVRRCERGGMGGVSYLIGATFEALLHDGGAAGAADGAGEDPCGGAFKDDAQELPRHLGTATASDSGRFERVLSALYLPRLAKWLARPDDYSTSRIGRFNARSSRRSTPRIDL